MKNIGFDFEAHFASDRACQGGRGEDSGPWGRFLFFAHRLVFPGAPRALGLYRTSRCSLANEPFGAHKFLNQMRIGDSDEIAGCRRVFSYGPSSRPGANISMASLFGSAPDLRFELRSKFPVPSIFNFRFQISKLSLRLDVLRKFRVAFRILRIWNSAFPIPRFLKAAFRGLSVSILSDFCERWSISRSPPSDLSRHYLFDLLARWL